jgi:hypothetical protein
LGSPVASSAGIPRRQASHSRVESTRAPGSTPGGANQLPLALDSGVAIPGGRTCSDCCECAGDGKHCTAAEWEPLRAESDRCLFVPSRFYGIAEFDTEPTP